MNKNNIIRSLLFIRGAGSTISRYSFEHFIQRLEEENAFQAIPQFLLQNNYIEIIKNNSGHSIFLTHHGSDFIDRYFDAIESLYNLIKNRFNAIGNSTKDIKIIIPILHITSNDIMGSIEAVEFEPKIVFKIRITKNMGSIIVYEAKNNIDDFNNINFLIKLILQEEGNIAPDLDNFS